MTLRISFYSTSGGNSPVQKYLDALDEHESVQLYAILARLEIDGLKRTLTPVRAIDGKLWELKIGKHRIFYVLRTRSDMVLLHVCKKQGRKARREDIELSRTRMHGVLDGG